MKTIIITETIDINEKEVLDVDPMILAEMKEKLNPTKAFSYAKGDHTKAAEKNEKKMRESK